MTEDLWLRAAKYAPLVALLLVLLWAGYTGRWYWGSGVRQIVRQLEAERNDWRSLALALLRERGVDVDLDSKPASPSDVLPPSFRRSLKGRPHDPA